jgi:Rieske Fe-S protein
MSLSRRHFLAGACACAGAALVSCAPNPARSFDAGADRSLPLPEELRNPGGQAKVRLPGDGGTVLVWRTDIGFGAVSLRCPHCGGEIVYDAPAALLHCPMGSKFKLDGTVRSGPARKPLRAYLADLQGERLRILG